MNSTTHSKVTVIIPTTAQKSRYFEIKRCVQSIRESSRHRIAIIAIVNGTRYDDEVCRWLKAQTDVRFEYVEKPSLPNAVLYGRELVTTPYFSFLDDDDEYLEGATDQRLAVLDASPDADLVVTNAYRRCEGVEETIYSNLIEVPANPLVSLFRENWLQNGNALYRSASIGTQYFHDYRQFAEWTWLAFKISMDGKRVAVLEHPTFRVHVTPNSLSQSEDYVNGYLPLLRSMIERKPSKEVICLIRKRMSATWHDHSVRSLQRGNLKDAVTCHLNSLFLPGGHRYLSYTRRLIPRPAMLLAFRK